MNIPALLAGLLSGIIGSMGLGGGAVLIIYLVTFTATEQLEAQGINLLFFLPTAATAVAVYAFKKKIRWKIILPLILGGIAGTAVGIVLTGFLGGKLTAKIFGALITAFGIREIFSKGNKKS